jgi:branched-chain amino acid transport system permease protein
MRLGLLLVAGVGYLLPAALSSYQTFEFTQVFIYAVALLGLNILIGYNGQFSLGHGAFYAIGAYTTAIMTTRWDIPYGWAIIAAGALSLVVGFLFGLPALRFEGLYLALATFALALATPQVLKYFDTWTGGSQGIVLDKPSVPLGLPISADQYLYYLSLTVLVILLLLAHNLLRGRAGRAITAIRDNPIAAEAMGVNAALYKSLTFGVSAMYTGIAGALGALAVAFVAPDTFSAFLSINFLVGSVVGGVASISGAIFGGAFIEFVPTYAQEISRAAPWAIFGLTLIIFMYVMPTGVAGLIRRVAAALARSMASEQPAPDSQTAAAEAAEGNRGSARAVLGKPD